MIVSVPKPVESLVARLGADRLTTFGVCRPVLYKCLDDLTLEEVGECRVPGHVQIFFHAPARNTEFPLLMEERSPMRCVD
jgi:hypothetical protein